MLRLGILGCSDIAYRRFMPAAMAISDVKVVAVAEEYDPHKLEAFCGRYGIDRAESFRDLIDREDIDAVYVPQPPALHFVWAKAALEKGKHVLLEKPSTTCFADTKQLVDLAKSKKLALHENYMFQYHSQIEDIQSIIHRGILGDVRLYRASFGFPLRQANDFRYNQKLGGGSLLDAGGYTIKLATLFLGQTAKIDVSCLNYMPGYEVDMYGNASLSNEEGTVFQIAFGMDCAYQCSLEVWGSKGILRTNRIFTAPDEYKPKIEISTSTGNTTHELNSDHHFEHSIERFCAGVEDAKIRTSMYEEITIQSRLVDEVKQKSSIVYNGERR